jgi:serine phosphatase RsbU (regulator of sigma subunit)/ligand-binding sensor domain-containing protein
MYGQSTVKKAIGYPLIQNFTSKQFVVSNYNWAGVQDHIGNMYFANSDGVLKYDGNSWDLIATESQVTSICFDSISKIIYVGMQNDFGYLAFDENNTYKFYSLAQKFNIVNKVSIVFFTIYTPNGIYFLTDKTLFRYANNKIKTWKATTEFASAIFANNKLFVREKEKGIHLLENDYLGFVKGSNVFSNSSLSMIAYKGNSNYLIASKQLGLLTFELLQSGKDYECKLNFIDNGTAELFQSASLYSGRILKDGNIALATEVGGLIIIDQLGNILTELTSISGIVSDLIIHVYEDKSGNLWLCSESGISQVMYSLPTYEFKEYGRITGATHSIVEFNGALFAGTSTGLFIYNVEKNIFERYKNFPSVEIWKLTKVKNNFNSMLVATTKGIFEITKNGIRLLSDLENVYCIKQSLYNDELFFVCHLNGLSIYTYKNGNFILQNQIDNCPYSIRDITEDSSHNLWLSTQENGIVYLEFSNAILFQKKLYLNEIMFGIEKGLPELSQNFVYFINGQLFVTTYNGLYTLNKKVNFNNIKLKELASLNFVREQVLDPYKNQSDIQIRIIKQGEGQNLWFVSVYPDGKHEIGLLKNSNGKLSWNCIPFKLQSTEKIFDVYPNKDFTWLGATDIVYSFDNAKKYNYKSEYNTQINAVSYNNDTLFKGSYFKKIELGDSIIKLVDKSQPEELIISLPYEKNDLTFSFAANSFVANHPAKFSCYLEGEDKNWSEWSSETFKTYMNLHEGNYVFKVKAKNVFGAESTVATYEFRILPPWYRTALAYILYAILAIAIVAGVVKFFTSNLNRIIKKQTAELQQQKDEIEHKNKEITDSIYYAKRIQDAIMPSNEYIKNMFSDSFVFFKPKDIVSGDFYWANLRESNAILAAVDCTGHGVPGAFMSMMGNDYLNDIIVDSKINEPDEILNLMRSGIIKALKQRGESGESKDGMDMALVKLNKTDLLLEYAGANNPIYIVRDKNQSVIENALIFSSENDKKVLYELKGNKFPVGIHMGTTLQPFLKHQIQLVKGDVFYIFSDGYADQFGGPAAKKLKYNQFKKFILESMFLTMEEQKIYLEQKLKEWQGDLEQVDDVLVIGVRIV